MTVFFIGPLPPPVHGFSAMNQAMFQQLRERTNTVLLNRAPPVADAAWRRVILRLGNTLAQLYRFQNQLRQNRQPAVYVALSGGWGQVVDTAFCVLARWAGARVFFHHHSYSYINQRSALTAWLFRCSGSRAQHIVLCACMGDALTQRYGLAAAQVHPMSNAALMPAAGPHSAAPERTPRPAAPVIGFLSNITAEKGIFHFFDALDTLIEAGCSHAAVIAGPVDPAIQNEFARRLAAARQAKYLGPVYAAEKSAFLWSLDLLFFPTQYANEAEPVTLLEAQQHGVAVVAAARGCIPDMVPPEAGQVVSLSGFQLAVVAAVQRQTELSTVAATARRAAIQQAFMARLETERGQLLKLLELMCQAP